MAISYQVDVTHPISSSTAPKLFNMMNSYVLLFSLLYIYAFYYIFSISKFSA